MNIKNVCILAIALSLTACVSIPKETVTISQMLGSDLQQLHKAHRNIIDVHFNKIKSDVNTFVDDVYAPYIIHYVLKNELNEYKEGRPSIYGTIETAGKQEGKQESNAAINEMSDFLTAAREQIESKRSELLTPIIQQETEIIMAVNQSYENAQYANSTITAYLQSIRKVKDAQQEALSMLGLQGVDSLITNSLVRTSEQVDLAVKQGKKIDIQSDEAAKQLEEIFSKIKKLTNKN